ncbi:hypothetical protein DX928_09835 [Bacillus swezeyi]|nr:hypothetical protein DX928_09835 [Bacillus swezeyi]
MAISSAKNSSHKNEIIFSSCKYEVIILQVVFKTVTTPHKSMIPLENLNEILFFSTKKKHFVFRKKF